MTPRLIALLLLGSVPAVGCGDSGEAGASAAVATAEAYVEAIDERDA